MSVLTSSAFSNFFSELHGYSPFAWQEELARQACEGMWPAYLAVPTGSGKTAALDAAIFALAVQAELPPSARTVGRRIFYVVNRRVIVDEAFDRARKIAQALYVPKSNQPTVARVASALRALAGSSANNSASPLTTVQLRGGIYRDNRWARSLTQAMVVTSTVDQVGSRLLFRGYGVSDCARPIHAALVAHDSLILLDEAHISEPFVQTLMQVQRFRSLGHGGISNSDAPPMPALNTPFAFLQMTATPPPDANSVLRLTEKDRENKTLSARLTATKPAKLMVAKASGAKALASLADALVLEALAIHERMQPRSIAVLVNRVATARQVARLLSEKIKGAPITLLIGRMRPIDRDIVTGELREQLRTRRPDESDHPGDSATTRFVVATQCLEVGADLDFDALVTECASLDALRQRFGRLNRGGRSISAQATVVIRSDQIAKDEGKVAPDSSAFDPIYKGALALTWSWLSSIAQDETVDFGIDAMDAQVTKLRISNEPRFASLLSPKANAPVLLPAYLDAWCQTNPSPVPEPEPALFLHGPGCGDPDVQVCWRADVPHESDDKAAWIQVVTACPPSSVECLNVPLGQLSRWIRSGSAGDANASDVLGAPPSEPSDEETPSNKRGLIWRGPRHSQLLVGANGLRPGDTVVLSAESEGWDILGHVPDATVATIDVGEVAFRLTRRREIIRLHPKFLTPGTGGFAFAELVKWSTNPDADLNTKELRGLLSAAADEFPEDKSRSRALSALAEKASGLIWERYPDQAEKGVILRTRRVANSPAAEAHGEGDVSDDGDDALSNSPGDEPIALDAHLADVLGATHAALAQLPLGAWRSAIECAAALHDWGKADERFQALLLDGDVQRAWAQPALLAKSAKIPNSPAAFAVARLRAALPAGFRHEMASVQLALTSVGAEHLPSDALLRDLTLHLIASHHGYARPFAPVVADDTPPDIELPVSASVVRLDGPSRTAVPPHRLDSGIPDRFWQLTRIFGWWGLPYLETVLRLADQQTSEAPSTRSTLPSNGVIVTS